MDNQETSTDLLSFISLCPTRFKIGQKVVPSLTLAKCCNTCVICDTFHAMCLKYSMDIQGDYVCADHEFPK